MPFEQLMFDQDTGGAIRTAGRADLYLGVGPSAEYERGSRARRGSSFLPVPARGSPVTADPRTRAAAPASAARPSRERGHHRRRGGGSGWDPQDPVDEAEPPPARPRAGPSPLHGGMGARIAPSACSPSRTTAPSGPMASSSRSWRVRGEPAHRGPRLPGAAPGGPPPDRRRPRTRDPRRGVPAAPCARSTRASPT